MGQHRYSTPAAEVETQEGFTLDRDVLMGHLIRGKAGVWTPLTPAHRSTAEPVAERCEAEMDAALSAGFMYEEACAELAVWFA